MIAPSSGRPREPTPALPHLAALISGALGLLGVIGYGLLSAGAARTYEVVGVQPREIGLGSGAVLAQTAIPVGITVVIMIMPIGFGILRGRWPRIRHLAILATVNLALTTALVFHFSSEARTALQQGQRTPPLLGPLALPSPWYAELARVQWVKARPAKIPLPACVLYLGTASGISVIYDHRQRHTLRVHQSRLVITVLPHVASC